MTPRHDPHDSQLDRNLHTVGAALPLPPAASARQRASWKRPPAQRAFDGGTPATPKGTGADRLRLGSIWTMAGSAVAAAILLGVFLLNPVQPSRVEAAMILRNFREAAHHGFRVTIEDIDVQGLRAEGEILMQFSEPVNFAQLMDLSNPVREPLWMTMNLSVTTSAEFADCPGLSLRLAGAAQGETEWFFARAERLPNALLEDLPAPIAWWLSSVLGGGIMLDLTGLDEERIATSLGLTPPAAMNPSGRGTETHLAVSAGTTSPTDSTALGFNFDAQLSTGAAAPADEASTDAVRSAAAVESAMLSLFSGQAGRPQLEELLSLLSSSSAAGQVQEVEPGLYWLTVSNFSGDDGAANPLIDDAVLRITYREQAGVESLVLEHIGSSDGSIRMEFCDDVMLTAERLDRNQWIEPGITTVIDAETIGSLIGLLAAKE